ncbi:MAG: type II toxin-antitoxin system HicB family antitoxin [Dehalococcoidia bacterium]
MRLTLLATDEDGEFVSECPELGVASQGSTVEEAFHNLKDALTTYLRTIENLGERPRIFRERGIKVLQRPPARDAVALKLRPNQIGTTSVLPIRAKAGGKAPATATG